MLCVLSTLFAVNKPDRYYIYWIIQLKIEQLLQREPFGDIIEKTLSRFFYQYFGTSHCVTWKKIGIVQRSFPTPASPNSEIFYCNPYLNILYSQASWILAAEFVHDNYRHTPLRSRRLIQKIYVALATSKLTAHFFTTHALEISPCLPESSNLVILGGNNRLRIIDLQKNRTLDILKCGFDPVFMERELKVRQTPGAWPFPQLYAAADDGTWFESEYVPAVSINRIEHGEGTFDLKTQAFQFLGDWLDQTCTSSLAIDYVGRLTDLIDTACSRSDWGNSSRRDLLRKFLDEADLLVTTLLKDVNLPIDLANGHGDFQHGNILADKNDVIWVVDWEHAGQRQLAYDYLVFALRSRFPAGLAERIHDALKDPEGLLSSLPVVHEKFRVAIEDARIRPVVLFVFLVEDLLWNLRENTNPLFTKTSGAMPQLLSECREALRAIRIFAKAVC